MSLWIEQEKVFINYVSKQRVSKRYKELKMLNLNKTNNPESSQKCKWLRNPLKMFNILSPLGKCKSKLVWEFILHQTESPRSIKQMTAHAGDDVWKGEHLFTAGESAILYNHYGNHHGSSSWSWESIYLKMKVYHSWKYKQRMLHGITDTITHPSLLLPYS